MNSTWPPCTIHYSDLFTLAGIKRVLAQGHMTAETTIPTIEVGIPVIRDERVPAGVVEVRWSDGRVERVLLTTERATPGARDIMRSPNE